MLESFITTLKIIVEPILALIDALLSLTARISDFQKNLQNPICGGQSRTQKSDIKIFHANVRKTVLES